MDTCRIATREAAIRAATVDVAAAMGTTRATVAVAVATITQLGALTRRLDREAHQVAAKDSIKTQVDRAADAAEWANRAEAVTWVECTEVREKTSKVLAEVVEAAAVVTKVTKATAIRAKVAQVAQVEQVASRTTKRSCASTSTRERLAHTPTTAHTPTACTSYASPTLKLRAAKWDKVCIKTRPSTSSST